MNEKKPRIAIPVPTTSDLPYNQRSWPMYAEAVRRSGGEPVEVSLGLPAQELRALAESCHGVCLPGSPADVDPARYGAELDPATSPADPFREACDFFLLDHAVDTRKPVLGICYGVQLMNVWRGGSLVQDLTPMPVNHSAGREVAVAHAAVIAQNSLLGRLLQTSAELQAEAPLAQELLRLPVNTSHHQSVASPGDGLRVVARCPDDGVIEAVEIDPSAWDDNPPAAFFLGVQWHPERSFDISAASRALFRRLVDEAGGLATRALEE